MLSALAAVALIATLTLANAAGITKTLKFTIADSSIGGYLKKPVEGYHQLIEFGLATASFNSYAIAYEALDFTNFSTSCASCGHPLELGDPAWITIINPSGVILSREKLPADMRPLRSDCTDFHVTNGVFTYNGCPAAEIKVYPLQQLPGRLMVTASWDTNNGSIFKVISYILDTTTAVGAAGRWALVSNLASSYNATFDKAVFNTAYFYDKTTAGTTKVYTIVNK